jgi:hypothetical protein
MNDKIEIYVRFANEGTYYNKILVNPSKIKDPNNLGDEVFCIIDGVRVAISKKEWKKLNINEKQNI